MGQPIEEKVSEMTVNELSKRICDMYQIRRDCHDQISKLNDAFEHAGNVIDCCEKELRKRGHI